MTRFSLEDHRLVTLLWAKGWNPISHILYVPILKLRDHVSISLHQMSYLLYRFPRLIEWPDADRGPSERLDPSEQSYRFEIWTRRPMILRHRLDERIKRVTSFVDVCLILSRTVPFRDAWFWLLVIVWRNLWISSCVYIVSSSLLLKRKEVEKSPSSSSLSSNKIDDHWSDGPVQSKANAVVHAFFVRWNSSSSSSEWSCKFACLFILSRCRWWYPTVKLLKFVTYRQHVNVNNLFTFFGHIEGVQSYRDR